MNTCTIIKRDGTEESFDRSKLKRVLMAAGLPEDESENVIEAIESWIKKHNLTSIQSIKLRDEILRELERINEPIANLYKWYETTKYEQTNH